MFAFEGLSKSPLAKPQAHWTYPGMANLGLDPMASAVVTTLASGRTFRLSQTLESQDLSPLFDDNWTGSHVWECSLLLADFVERRVSTEGLIREGTAVCELGSGCGLVALTAHAHGAFTVATDQAAMMKLIARNADANIGDGAGKADKNGSDLGGGEGVSRKANGRRRSFLAAELTWGSQEDLAAMKVAARREHYDLLLISDCLNPVYGEDSYRDLATTVKALSHSSTRLLLAYKPRGDRDLVGQFLGHLKGWFQLTTDDGKPVEENKAGLQVWEAVCVKELLDS